MEGDLTSESKPQVLRLQLPSLIKGANKGATIVFVGYSASGEMTLPIGMALDKELTFKTVFRYRNIYPMAIDAVASGKIITRYQ